MISALKGTFLEGKYPWRSTFTQKSFPRDLEFSKPRGGCERRTSDHSVKAFRKATCVCARTDWRLFSFARKRLGAKGFGARGLGARTGPFAHQKLDDSRPSFPRKEMGTDKSPLYPAKA
eukprot:2593322-Pleurochrysis_carterae.AAC.1